MKSTALFVVTFALLAATLPAQAQRAYPEGAAPTAPLATTDPFVRIYRISGVRDNGAGNEAGVATSFHCSSASTANESVRIVVRHFDGTVAGSRTFTLAPNRTVTMSTHFTRLFFEDTVISRGIVINSGSADILATSVNIFCSAMILNAGTASPEGIALHMVRFNAAAGSQE
jgi:hypothetical protein